MRHQVKIRIVGKWTKKSLEFERELLWGRLRKCGPFVRGSIHVTGKNKDGYALANRDGKKVKNTYFPKRELKEMRLLAENYKKAKGVLALIADCELKLRILAREGASKTK